MGDKAPASADSADCTTDCAWALARHNKPAAMATGKIWDGLQGVNEGRNNAFMEMAFVIMQRGLPWKTERRNSKSVASNILHTSHVCPDANKTVQAPWCSP
jgi:hypothetical protein